MDPITTDRSKAIEYAAIIGDMIVQGPSTEPIPTLEAVSTSLQSHVQATAGGNITAFSGYVGVKRASIKNVLNCNARPDLMLFVKLCLHADVKPTDYLTGSIDIAWDQKGLAQPVLRRKVLRRPITTEEKKHIKFIFEKALKEQPPPTRRAVNKRFESFSRAHRCFPELIRQVSDRRKVYVKAEKIKRNEEIIFIIKEAMHEIPPPSVHEVSRRVGLSVCRFRECFRSHSFELAQRYLQGRARSAVERENHFHTELKSVVIELNNMGIYPSYAAIKQRLDKRRYLNLKDRSFVKKLRADLGIMSS